MTASTRNPQRAAAARAALLHYADRKGRYAEDMTVELWDDYAADLLADLMHLADTIERDITDPLTSAERNYHAEVEGDDLTEDDNRMHAAEFAADTASPEHVVCPSCAADLTAFDAVNYSASEDGTAHAEDGTWCHDKTENVYDLGLSCSNCGEGVYDVVMGPTDDEEAAE